MRKELGEHIFTDPKVGGGELRFTGTRIPVKDALHLAAKGYSPKKIAKEYHDLITEEAVLEAIALASEAWTSQYEPS